MKLIDIIREDAQPEAPEDAALGKYAFPANRQGLPNEPDTFYEKTLYRKLDAFVNHNRTSALTKEDIAQIQSFIKNGYYQKVFHEPPTQLQLMRGISVDKEWLEDRLLDFEDDDSLPQSGTQKGTFFIRPKNAASSWTATTDVANEFAHMGGGGEFAVILHAKPEDNPGKFIQGPGGWHNISSDWSKNGNSYGMAEFERECIGFGMIKVYMISWKPLMKF